MTKQDYYTHKKKFSHLIKTMRFHNYERMVQGLVEWCKLIPSGASGVEIGSFAGESTLIMLESIPDLKLVCVDPWLRDYYSKKQIPAAEETFDKAVGNRVKKLIMTSDKALEYLINHEKMKFDFVYIDGNHHYDFVKQDIINSLKIIKPGGILGGHDYRFKGSPGVIKALLEVMGGEADYIFPDYSFAYRV